MQLLFVAALFFLVAKADWLITAPNVPVTFVPSTSGTSMVLSNGLITREFQIQGGFGTVQFFSHIVNRSLLRCVEPEAMITLDNVSYFLGDLYQQEPLMYLNHSNCAGNASAWGLANFTASAPQAPYPWTPGARHSPNTSHWPPRGLRVEFALKPPHNVAPQHAHVSVSIVYEMYENLPLLSKWITANAATGNVVVTTATVEYLAVTRSYAPYPSFGGPWGVPDTPSTAPLLATATIPHGAQVNFVMDADVNTLDYGSANTILTASYAVSVGVALGSFTSFRVLELVTDTTDFERAQLSKHRMTRALAPQVQENPIFFHGTIAISPGMRYAVDQLVEVGYEMFIYSFGSGFDLESTDETYLESIKADIAYANQKGIEVGGYDLICLDRSDLPSWLQNLNPDGSLGGDACFASSWVDTITAKFLNFVDNLGLTGVETDGPYGGELCSSTNHSHHTGLADSIYQQNELQSRFFYELRKRNVYIHQPDSYFFSGGNKAPMGYSEMQYNLPRWQDLTVSRQGLYDDTYSKVVTQGWMFVPLVQYHGGGNAAQFEPLSENIADFEWALQQYFLLGVFPCWRGFEIFDNNATKTLVKKYVEIYKAHRAIITSDFVHVRRADLQSWDAMMHVNPFIQEKGFLVIFNPTQNTINATIPVPVYYTGLHDTVTVQHEDNQKKVLGVDRDYNMELDISMPPRTVTWYVMS